VSVGALGDSGAGTNLKVGGSTRPGQGAGNKFVVPLSPHFFWLYKYIQSFE